LPNEFVGGLRPNERLRRGNRRRHVASVPAVTRHLGSDRAGVEFGATPGTAHARDLGCTYAWVGTEADNAPARGLYERAGGVAEPFVLYGWDLAPPGGPTAG
jgi:hypothetical protein